MATHLWDLPPLTPPAEEVAPAKAPNEKGPSPEQRPATRADSLGAASKQRDAILDRMGKAQDTAPTGSEATQLKAHIPSATRREEAPEPVPAEYRQAQQEPRAKGHHRLMWEVVGARTDQPGTRLPEFKAVERPVEQTGQSAQHAVKRAPNQSVVKEIDGAASNLIEQTRRRLDGEVVAALETFGREVNSRLHALEEGHLSHWAAKLEAEITEQTQRLSDNFGEVRCSSLESLSEQLQGRLKEQLDGVATDLVEQMRGRLRSEMATALETFSQEVGARLRTLEQEPSIGKLRAEMTTQLQEQLRQELDEGVRKSAQELEADSRAFLQRQRDSAQKLLDEKLAATILESRQLLKREVQTVMVECRDRLLREIGPAAAPKAEAERENPPTKPRESVVRPIEIYRAGPPDPRQEFTQLHEVPRLRAVLHATLRAAVWLIPVAPILVFLILSIHPVMHLRGDPPAQFSEGPPGPNVTQPATEERLARAYWDLAVQYVQPKYGYGTKLPDEPVSEFKVDGTVARRGSSKSDSDTRRLYWRRLRQVWVLPQTWQQAYVWDTGWMDGALGTLQGMGRRLVDGTH